MVVCDTMTDSQDLFPYRTNVYFYVSIRSKVIKKGNLMRPTSPDLPEDEDIIITMLPTSPGVERPIAPGVVISMAPTSSGVAKPTNPDYL